MSATTNPTTKKAIRHPFRRRVWEPITLGAMLLGFALLLQPFSLALFSASFGVMLFGVLGYAIAGRLPG